MIGFRGFMCLFIGGMVLICGSVFAGNIDAPAAPSAPGSAMFTLEDLYNRLNAGTAGTKRSGAFLEPVAGPGATMHSIDDLMNKAPAVDGAGAAPADVLSGKAYWGLTAGQWGPRIGTMPNIGSQSFVPGIATQTISQGYHDGTGTVSGDPSLVSGNIKAGATIFGIAGSANVTDTSTGNATPGELISGRKAWVGGNEITGTIPVISPATITPGVASQAIPAGYHDGSGRVLGDASLVSGNIKAGATIFGVTGNANVTDTSTGNATAGELISGRKAWVGGSEITGTIPVINPATITPGIATQAISAGYHHASGQVSGDPNLVSGNIKAGITIFGVSGNSNVVDTSTGDALATEILPGRKAWVAGSEVTGAMTVGSGTLVPGTATQTIPTGYYSGLASISGDANLVSGNIKSGMSIFGVGGNTNVVDTSPASASGRTILLGNSAYADGVFATGTRVGGVPLESTGMFWPGGQRWFKPGDGTVIDCRTGLVWLSNVPHVKRPYLATSGTELDCMQWLYSICHGQYGLTDNSQPGDWDMPTLKEMESLFIDIPVGQGIGSFSSHAFDNPYLFEYYWTSTPQMTGYGTSSADKIYIINMRDGTHMYENKIVTSLAEYHYVWPIRRGFRW